MYLNAHTYYSLRYGTLSPVDLVRAAKERGIRTLVLTDINNTSCSFDFIRACGMEGLRPILGIEFRQDHQLLYIGIAKNQEGFRELNAWLTKHSLEKKKLSSMAPLFQHAFVIYPRSPKPLEDLNDHEFIGIRPELVNTLYRSPLLKHQHKLVAWSPVTFLDRDGYHTHRILRSIDLNTLLSKLDKTEHADEREIFYTKKQFHQFYQLYPSVLENTQALLDQCSIKMQHSLQHNRQTFSGSKEGDFSLLQKLAYNGWKLR